MAPLTPMVITRRAVFEMKDDVVYDEFFDANPIAGVQKGDPVIKQDTFGFYMRNALRNNWDATTVEMVAVIYRCRQVYAQKMEGSSEEFKSGDRVYFYPASCLVSPNRVGTYGQDFYFCGWAKRDALASEPTVWINFDGTRWFENI